MAELKHEIKVKIDYGDNQPKWIKIPYTPGDSIYVTNDPEQREFIFVGFSYVGENLYHTLHYLGEETEVLAIETSPVKDFTKATGGDIDEEP